MSEAEQAISIEALDRLFPPPIPDELLELVQEQQYAYDEHAPTPEQIEDDMRTLDQLLPILDETVNISGYVYMPVTEDPENPNLFTVRRVFLDDAFVRSLGFNAINTEGELNNGVTSNEESRVLIGYQFALPREVISSTFFYDATVQKKVFALPGDLTITRQDEEALSLFDKVHHFFPDIAAEIDDAVMKANSTSEAVIALADVSSRESPFVVEGSLRLLDEYVNSLFTFDTRAPYHMDFEGDCFAVLPNEPTTIYGASASGGLAVACPKKIEVLTTPIRGKYGQITDIEVSFGIRILIAEKNIERDDNTEYIVPITDKLKMHDVRSLVYIAFQMAQREAEEAQVV